MNSMYQTEINFPIEAFDLSNVSLPNDTSNKSFGSSDVAQLGNSDLAKGLTLLAIALFSLAGNVLTLVSIRKKRYNGYGTDYMLLEHFALVNFLLSLFSILTEGLWALGVAWNGSDFLCKTTKFFQSFSICLSTFILVLIVFDRLSAVYSKFRTHARQRVSKTIFFVWIISGFLSVPQCHPLCGDAASTEGMSMKTKAKFLTFKCFGFYVAKAVFSFSVRKKPFFDENLPHRLHTICTIVVLFFLPLVILIAANTAIFITISNWKITSSEGFIRRLQNGAMRKNPRKFQKTKVKPVIITIITSITHIIFWTPYYIMMINFMFFDVQEDPFYQDLQSAFFYFGCSTALMYPVIYWTFHFKTKKVNNRHSCGTDNITLTTDRRTYYRKTTEDEVTL